MKTSGASSVILLDEKTISSIEHFIGMAVRNEMPWDGLSSILENLALTVEKSRQIINILLISLQSKQQINGIGSKNSQNKQKQQTQNKSSKKVGKNLNSSCDKCGEKFINSIALKKHMKIHEDSDETTKKLVEMGEKVYTFIGDLGNLQGNETSSVEKEVAYDDSPKNMVNKKLKKCKFCEKTFNLKGNLTNHERIHTGEVPFECRTCKRRFRERSNLIRHEKIHSNEKPFQCRNCKYKTVDKRNLERHERSHTGERPFQCKMCPKSFTQSQHLTTHIRIHTGERPYKCFTCDRCFVSNSLLRQHERSAHKQLK